MTNPSRAATEAALIRAVQVAFGARPNLRIWRNNTGALATADRFVRFGLEGSADFLGILGPRGLFFAIECKSSSGRQTEQQKAFQAMVERFGGLYILARSVEDIETALREVA